MKSFLNYFASKTIFLNILQNVTIYCIYLNILSYITIIPQNDTLLHHRTNQISLKYLCCIVLQNTFLAQEYMKLYIIDSLCGLLFKGL